jgi:hypothetical protein
MGIPETDPVMMKLTLATTNTNGSLTTCAAVCPKCLTVGSSVYSGSSEIVTSLLLLSHDKAFLCVVMGKMSLFMQEHLY